MTPAAVIVAISVAIIGVLGTIIGVLLRNSKRSPESKDAQTNAWGQLNDRMNKHLDWLTTRVTNLETENTAKNEKIATLDNKVEGLESDVEGFRVLVLWLRARIAQLTKHITDQGDTPPEAPTPEPGP